ncbi:MAG: hypothetical protein AAFO15_00575 [Pseudomonadota bacterium]
MIRGNMFYCYRIVLILFFIVSVNSIADDNEVLRYKIANNKERIVVTGSGTTFAGGGGCTYGERDGSGKQVWNGNERIGALDWSIILGSKDRCYYHGCLKQFGFNDGQYQYCAERYRGYDPFGTAVGNPYIVTVRYQGGDAWKYDQEFIHLRIGQCKEMGDKRFCARIISPSSSAYMLNASLGFEGEYKIFDINEYAHKVSENSVFQNTVIDSDFALPQVGVFVYHIPGWQDKVGLLFYEILNMGGTLDQIGNALNYDYLNKLGTYKLYLRSYMPSAIYPTREFDIANTCQRRCKSHSNYILESQKSDCYTQSDKDYVRFGYDCRKILRAQAMYCRLYDENCTNGQTNQYCDMYYDKCHDSTEYDLCLQKLKEKVNHILDKCLDDVDDFIYKYLLSCSDTLADNKQHGNFSESMYCRNGLGYDAGYMKRTRGGNNTFTRLLELIGEDTSHLDNPIAHLGSVPIPLGGGHIHPLFETLDNNIFNNMLKVFSICGGSIVDDCYRSNINNNFIDNRVRIMQMKVLNRCLYHSDDSCFILSANFISPDSIHRDFNDFVPICNRQMNQFSDTCVSLNNDALLELGISDIPKFGVAIYGEKQVDGSYKPLEYYQPEAHLIGINIGRVLDIDLQNIDNNLANIDSRIAYVDTSMNGYRISAEILKNDPQSICVHRNNDLLGCVDRAQPLPSSFFIDDIIDKRVVIKSREKHDFELGYDLDSDMDVSIFGYKYSLRYANEFGDYKSNIYDTTKCKGVTDEMGVCICGEYFQNQNKFINNEKNKKAYFLGGLEFINGIYDRGATFVCLNSATSSRNAFILKDKMSEYTYPEADTNGVVTGEFNLFDMNNVCLSALKQKNYFDGNSYFKNELEDKLLQKDFDFNTLIASNAQESYNDAQKNNIFFQVGLTSKISIGCVVKNNRISALFNSDKYILVNKNDVQKGNCFALPKKILSQFAYKNAIWDRVELGKYAIGVCRSGYIPKNSKALRRLGVLDFNNNLILRPALSIADDYGCKKRGT